MQKHPASVRRVESRVARDASRAETPPPQPLARAAAALRLRWNRIRVPGGRRPRAQGAVPAAGRRRPSLDPMSFLRAYVFPLTAQRRGPTILAVLLLAFASVLTQVPSTGLGAPGGTGGTTGLGQAYNPRIAALNAGSDVPLGPAGGASQPSGATSPQSASSPEASAGATLPGLGSGPRLAGYGGTDGAGPGSAQGSVSGADGSGPAGPGADSATPSASPSPADATSQFGVDGSLIKPYAVDANVPDISGQVRTYTVQSGDTLTGIASRFGLSMMTIWWANKLTSADELHIGQKLLIPPTDGVLYTVQQGDTLDSIAKEYGAKASDIVSYNGLKGDTVVIGQQLMIPGGHGAPIPTPSPQPQPQPVQVAQGGGAPYVGSVPAYGGEAVFTSCSTCAFHGQMQWPVPGGYISQYFWWGHPAIDIAAPMGNPIVAAAAGVVTFAGWRNNGGGYQIWISHGQNVYTTYNHLSSILISAGVHVAQGQLIGKVGMTGDATGPHCHFEVWIGPIWDGGYRVNPLDFVHR